MNTLKLCVKEGRQSGVNNQLKCHVMTVPWRCHVQGSHVTSSWLLERTCVPSKRWVLLLYIMRWGKSSGLS